MTEIIWEKSVSLGGN